MNLYKILRLYKVFNTFLDFFNFVLAQIENIVLDIYDGL